MSVWDTYGIKAEFILTKSWIQTPKEGYDNRFDEVLTFVWKGVGYMILCFWRAPSDFGQQIKMGQKFHEMGRHEAPRAHIFS